MPNENQQQKDTQKSIVYIVDDDPAMRDSLAVLLRSRGISPLTYASAMEFLDQSDKHPESCLLLDIRMPEMSGLELHHKLIGNGIQIPTIMITGHGDVPIAVQAMKAGVFDFIEKPFRKEHLVERVHACLNRAEEQHTHEQQLAEVRDRIGLLTTRERQVLDAIVAGNSSKVIAHELGISVKTVDVHRSNIMHKLKTRNVASLVHEVSRLEKEK